MSTAIAMSPAEQVTLANNGQKTSEAPSGTLGEITNKTEENLRQLLDLLRHEKPLRTPLTWYAQRLMEQYKSNRTLALIIEEFCRVTGYVGMHILDTAEEIAWLNKLAEREGVRKFIKILPYNIHSGDDSLELGGITPFVREHIQAILKCYDKFDHMSPDQILMSCERWSLTPRDPHYLHDRRSERLKLAYDVVKALFPESPVGWYKYAPVLSRPNGVWVWSSIIGRGDPTDFWGPELYYTFNYKLQADAIREAFLWEKDKDEDSLRTVVPVVGIYAGWTPPGLGEMCYYTAPNRDDGYSKAVRTPFWNSYLVGWMINRSADFLQDPEVIVREASLHPNPFYYSLFSIDWVLRWFKHFLVFCRGAENAPTADLKDFLPDFSE